ncbi:MAG: cation:dicarboxylase symporter family transporter, partial [Gemmatimonadetes bacterium]|nr:cation:dicarboxylase symporter family transporter [Gemmatimonadota bacterium]
ATHAATLAAVVRGFEAVGTLWINAVRMTVVPLVVALVITGVVSTADSRRVGRLGALALPVFLAFLLTGGVFTLLVAPLSLDRLVISPETAESLRAGGAAVSAGAAGTGAPQMPSLVQRIVEMVPASRCSWGSRSADSSRGDASPWCSGSRRSPTRCWC